MITETSHFRLPVALFLLPFGPAQQLGVSLRPWAANGGDAIITLEMRRLFPKNIFSPDSRMLMCFLLV